MNDSEQALGAPVQLMIGDDLIQFPRINAEQYQGLEDAVRQARMQFITGLIERSKLSGTDKFVAFRDNYSPWIDPVQVAAYLRTYDGAVRAITISLDSRAMSGERIGGLVKRFSFPKLSNLALILAGFMPFTPDPSSEEAGESLLDPTLAPSSNPEIGAPSAQPSAASIPAPTPVS
jgi:hypothetical protein